MNAYDLITGPAKDVADYLTRGDDSLISESQLICALINAMNRIDQLEKRVLELEPQ